jgi:hypothetical protein
MKVSNLMPDKGAPQLQNVVTELRVSAHLMSLDPGVFCVFQLAGGAPTGNGLPGIRLTLPPGIDEVGSGVEIRAFRNDGWVGDQMDAALIRVRKPAQVLVTIYQGVGDQARAPNLQVVRLNDAPTATDGPEAVMQRLAVPEPAKPTAPASIPEAELSPEESEISAHIQLRGDVLGRLGEWMGDPGSQRWIEGFALAPKDHIVDEDLEYQAVLGRGWLSPWVQGGQFCGSRGMALPILGLRVRLRGQAAETHDLVISASFLDGTRIGPVGQNEPCEAESLSPLEAFRIELLPHPVMSEPDDLFTQPLPDVQGEAPGDARAPVKAAKRRR